MSAESRDSLQELWAGNQEEEEMTADFAELTARSVAFNSKIRRRNLVESVVGVLVVLLCGVGALIAPVSVVQAACALTCVGVVVILVILHVHGPPEAPAPADFDTEAFMARHVDHLRREAKLLRWVPVWYIGPLLPGMLLIEGWVLYAAWPAAVANSNWSGLAAHVGFQVAVIGGVFAMVIFVNWRASVGLAADADALDARGSD